MGRGIPITMGMAAAAKLFSVRPRFPLLRACCRIAPSSLDVIRGA